MNQTDIVINQDQCLKMNAQGGGQASKIWCCINSQTPVAQYGKLHSYSYLDHLPD